jgi:phosphoribosyl 1,2-cyclic phosphodiesterase
MRPRGQAGPPDETTALTFWGVRGSIPVPGPDTVVFGGNTSCMEVCLAASGRETRIILDAGTGIRGYGTSREWSAGDEVHLLLSHLHHDHVMGLPYLKAAFVKDLTLHIWCGNLGGVDAREALHRMFSPPLFPFASADLSARIIWHGFKAGETIDIDGHEVSTILLNHPSGSTGYRFGTGASSLAVLTDVEHNPDRPEPALVQFCKHVDTLVYDTMLEEGVYLRCKGWGHSTAVEGVKLARAAGCRRLIGFHHAPDQTDADMDRREAGMQLLWPESAMAREGQTLVCRRSNAQARHLSAV